MQAINEDFLKTIKSADWYFEFCDAQVNYLRAKKTYDAAIFIMKHLTREQVTYVIENIVPDVVRDMVREDLKR